MTNSLGIADFPSFFKAVWGYPPFDWQVRLLERVRTKGWPSTLDLPTGSGKTAALDVALFALALDAFERPADRHQARRVALVVDRRVVVDQAYARAVSLANSLSHAKRGVLATTAAALRELQKDANAVPVLPAILRGGMPREADWARTPHQPVLLVSTVDQVGSRLLFRGYGVTNSMKPIHAGLLGCDTLYLLDEVHLSRPFEETLDAVRHYSMRSYGPEFIRPLTFVRMSATVAERTGDTFTLSATDRQQESLSTRLRASKVASLREVKTPKSAVRAREALAKACVAEAVRLTRSEARVVAVIVNRVDTARQAAALAVTALAAGWEVRLMTGRMRPLDRDDLQRDLLARIRAGRERNPEDRLLLVSTQAIEAGADLDFDALVTECASLDALRQRFGRLDRMGELGTTEAVILAGSRDVEERAEPDPIYGRSLRNTWCWLSGIVEAYAPGVDVGVDALDHRLATLDSEEQARLLAPRAVAPVLMGSHVDRWAQTSPIPSADPDVAPFLHGPDRGAPDVQIVWRADIEATMLTDDELERVRALLATVPPSALEALPVPAGTVRSWLALVAAREAETASSLETEAIADVEGSAVVDEIPSRRTIVPDCAPAVVWRGEHTALLDATGPGALRPGDTLVVPSGYGGLDPDFRCWSPEAREPVSDRGDEAQLRQRGRAVVRWSAAVLASWGLRAELAYGPSLAGDADHEEDVDIAAELGAFDGWRVEVLETTNVPAWARVALEAFAENRRIARGLTGGAVWRVTLSPRHLTRAKLRSLSGVETFDVAPTIAVTTEEDGSSFTGGQILLDRHLEHVRATTRRLADALALPEHLATDLELAAAVHDLGKCDRRFQLMLHAGDPVALALADKPLAKSASTLPAGDDEARARARERSGYPRGTRHELTTVALIQHCTELRTRAQDWDLVLHLVAAHHGQCRPFVSPPDRDRDPVEVVATLDGLTLSASSDHDLVRFDSGIAERYWRLVHRYGWWRLSWLETILRLADHRASEQESRQ